MCGRLAITPESQRPEGTAPISSDQKRTKYAWQSIEKHTRCGPWSPAESMVSQCQVWFCVISIRNHGSCFSLPPAGSRPPRPPCFLPFHLAPRQGDTNQLCMYLKLYLLRLIICWAYCVYTPYINILDAFRLRIEIHLILLVSGTPARFP